MSLFNRGGDTKSQTTQSTQNLAENLNLQDTEGVAVGKVGGNLKIITTDLGAIDRAFDLSEDALSIGESNYNRAIDTVLALQGSTNRVVDQAITTIERGSNSAFEYGDRANQRAIESISEAYQDTADQSSSILDRVLKFVGDLQTGAQEQLGGTVTALNTIAREQSKSTDERVVEVSTQAQKTVLYSVVVLALAAVAYAAFRKP